jgi:hypothetical protein
MVHIPLRPQERRLPIPVEQTSKLGAIVQSNLHFLIVHDEMRHVAETRALI